MSKFQPKQNIVFGRRLEPLKAINQETTVHSQKVNPNSTWCGEKSSFGEVDHAKSYVDEVLNLAFPGESCEELPMVEEPIFASMEERFEDWMHKYNVQYKDDAEKEKRFKIFERKAKMVDQWNKDFVSRQVFCKFRTNFLADQTDEEKARIRNGSRGTLASYTKRAALGS